MAAAIIAQHAEMRRQISDLRIPHGEVRAERIAEEQPGRIAALVAVDVVVKPMAGQVEIGHEREAPIGKAASEGGFVVLGATPRLWWYARCNR